MSQSDDTAAMSESGDIAAMSLIGDIAAMSPYHDVMTDPRALLNARSLPRLGTAVRTLRTRRGWTQLELAERAGVSRQWLIKCEAGQTSGLEIGLILQVLDSLAASLMVRDELR